LARAAETLMAGLNLLKKISVENPTPPVARSRMAALQSAFPDVGLELIWQRERFDNSLQYDLLLSDSEGTISLGFSPDAELPWPLRGVQRWSEDDLLVVNNTTLKVQEAIALLDPLWHDESLLVRLVNACIIREELERDPPPISQPEVQAALDELRAELSLFDAAETHAWMDERGLSHERLEMWATDRVAFRKVRERATASAGREYYLQHRRHFDLFTFLTIRGNGAADVPVKKDIALATLARNVESLATKGDALTLEMKTLRRWELPPLLRKSLDADPGGQIAPVRSGREVVLVLAITSTEWDPSTSEAVRFAAFSDWLAERRRQDRIDWFWGDQETTAALGTLG
jgi:putative peptide maturation system protein